MKVIIQHYTLNPVLVVEEPCSARGELAFGALWGWRSHGNEGLNK